MSAVILPKGSIAIWFGDKESIPNGWSLCDGANNTPNIAGRFIRGCDTDVNFGLAGGSVEHNHRVKIESPAEGIYVRKAYDKRYFETISGSSEVKFVFDGNTESVSSYPPYHALYNVLCTATTNQIPTGIITIWSGPAGTHPPGWAMCDGTNGTPQLTDYFVIQPDDKDIKPFSVNNSTEHSHHIVIDGVMKYETRWTDGKSWSVFNTGSTPTAHLDTQSEAASSIPPYYALSYIMKL